MKSILIIYRLLLRLYPGSFRGEFEEQMLLDFADMAVDAREKGRFSFLSFCLRELIDFPVNLLRVHLKEGGAFRILRSQPVNFGVRGALGFGIGFAILTFGSFWIGRLLYSAFDPVLRNYSVWYWETFQNERWIGLLDTTVMISSYVLRGVFFGLLFSLLAGNHSKRRKYFWAGSLAWLLPNLISYIVSNSFGWSHFLSEGQSYALGLTISVFTGTFWGASLGFAESNWKVAPQYLAFAVIGYPLVTYLSIRSLFSLWLEITPWFFISLMVPMITLITGVVVVAIFTDRKMLWAMVAGAMSSGVLHRAAYMIAYQFLHLPQFPLGTVIPPNNLVMYEISWAASEAIFGIMLGLLLGVIFGYQQKNIQARLEGI